MLFIGTGVIFIGQGIFGQILEAYLLNEFNIKAPNLELWGSGFIVLGLFILILDVKYKLIPSVFATTKNTRIIYLGSQKYQFVFDKKMRVIPTISFEKPNYKENSCSISNWSESGFIVQFEKNRPIDEIQYWADAWKGLSLTQKALLATVNLFRKEDNKINANAYESSFTERQIHKINDT